MFAEEVGQHHPERRPACGGGEAGHPQGDGRIHCAGGRLPQQEKVSAHNTGSGAVLFVASIEQLTQGGKKALASGLFQIILKLYSAQGYWWSVSTSVRNRLRPVDRRPTGMFSG